MTAAAQRVTTAGQGILDDQGILMTLVCLFRKRYEGYRL